MREFFQETTAVTIVAIIAIVIATVLDVICNFPFKSIFSNICYSVIAAYIFYVFQIYIPGRKKKKLLAARIRDYIMWRILKNLDYITETIDNNETRDSLSEEAAGSIIKEATEAYNNLFKCTDDFARVIDDNILDVIIGLSVNPFLYGLYCLRHNMDDNCSNRDIIIEFYEKYGNDFKNLKNKLSVLIESLPKYDTELLDEVKKRANHSQ